MEGKVIGRRWKKWRIEGWRRSGFEEGGDCGFECERGGGLMGDSKSGVFERKRFCCGMRVEWGRMEMVRNRKSFSDGD
jgi:hypothetical protein